MEFSKFTVTNDQIAYNGAKMPVFRWCVDNQDKLRNVKTATIASQLAKEKVCTYRTAEAYINQFVREGALFKFKRSFNKADFSVNFDFRGLPKDIVDKKPKADHEESTTTESWSRLGQTGTILQFVATHPEKAKGVTGSDLADAILEECKEYTRAGTIAAISKMVKKGLLNREHSEAGGGYTYDFSVPTQVPEVNKIDTLKEEEMITRPETKTMKATIEKDGKTIHLVINISL